MVPGDAEALESKPVPPASDHEIQAARSWFHSLQMKKAALGEGDLLQSPFPWGM